MRSVPLRPRNSSSRHPSSRSRLTWLTSRRQPPTTCRITSLSSKSACRSCLMPLVGRTSIWAKSRSTFRSRRSGATRPRLAASSLGYSSIRTTRRKIKGANSSGTTKTAREPSTSTARGAKGTNHPTRERRRSLTRSRKSRGLAADASLCLPQSKTTMSAMVAALTPGSQSSNMYFKKVSIKSRKEARRSRQHGLRTSATKT